MGLSVERSEIHRQPLPTCKEKKSENPPIFISFTKRSANLLLEVRMSVEATAIWKCK